MAATILLSHIVSMGSEGSVLQDKLIGSALNAQNQVQRFVEGFQFFLGAAVKCFAALKCHTKILTFVYPRNFDKKRI